PACSRNGQRIGARRRSRQEHGRGIMPPGHRAYPPPLDSRQRQASRTIISGLAGPAEHAEIVALSNQQSALSLLLKIPKRSAGSLSAFIPIALFHYFAAFGSRPVDGRMLRFSCQ